MKQQTNKQPETNKQGSKLAEKKLIYKSQLLSYIPRKNKWNLKLKTQ